MIAGLYKIFDHWHTTGTVWVYSDPHFGDTELETGIHNRPTAEEQVKMINSKCGRADTLIILGDVGDVSYVRQLRAKHKVLIMGNHDAGRTNYERNTGHMCLLKSMCWTTKDVLDLFHSTHPGYHVNITETEDSWVLFYDNQLFDEVYEGPLMIAEKLILSHESVDIPWAYNIHGHDHTGRKSDKQHLNVCSDVINYTPINFNQFMKSGALAHIDTIHRETIDKAIVRKKKRGGKSIGK